MSDSAQLRDQNDYITIENNPISRSGVFQYLGRSISKEADPDKIYNVYRPDEELNNADAINSFKLIPWIDDHVMLGPESKGLTPAEKKGIHGTTGENVKFQDGVLSATLKLYSAKLQDMLRMGKKALSLGYRCKFIKESGVYQGQAYDYIQRNLRGNHLALVDSPRCDVAVLDSQCAFDHFDLALDQEELITMADEDRMKKIEDSLKGICDRMDARDASEKEEKEKKDAEDKAIKDAASVKPGSGGSMAGADAEEEEKKKKEAMDKKAKDEDDKKEKEGMDSAIKSLTTTIETLQKDGFKAIMKEAGQRDALAAQLAPFIGVFDHAEMTQAEVAKYGIEKLKIAAPAGQEVAVLTGFLHGRKPETQSFGLDSGIAGKKGKYAAAKEKRSA